MTQLQAAVSAVVAFVLIVGGVAWLCVPAAVITAGVLWAVVTVLLYDPKKKAGSRL